MSVLWLNPVAWWGLAAVAVPVLIHLLARVRSRRLPFPSLRFLRPAQLTALRRREITDWLLLAVRVAIVIAAVAALAGPVFVSPARRDAWQQRVARAIVVAGEASVDAADIAAGEEQTSDASVRIAARRVPDGLVEAVMWLQRQPPAAREVVVIADLREGSLTASDLDVVPPFVGLRFLPVPPQDDAGSIRRTLVADDEAGRVRVFEARITPTEDRTHVRYETATQPPPGVRVVASPAEQAHADALLRAVWRTGVLVGSLDARRLTVAFQGADLEEGTASAVPSQEWMRRTLASVAGLSGGESDGELIVVAPLAATDPRAPALLARVVQSAFGGSFAEYEPRRIAADVLAAWTRPPGAPPAEAPVADEGDRRWLWLAALLLLGVEYVIRRPRHDALTVAGNSDASPAHEETPRVA